MGNSWMAFSRAAPRERQFRSDRPAPVPHSHAAAQEAEKTMMPTVRKCYIVRRATALWRKDSL
jgi:hypothetical protein